MSCENGLGCVRCGEGMEFCELDEEEGVVVVFVFWFVEGSGGCEVDVRIFVVCVCGWGL